MWSKRDSDNLELLARSLAKIAELEQETRLINLPNKGGFLHKLLNLKSEHSEINVVESPSLEDTYLEEQLDITQRARSKIQSAQRSNNLPFFAEDLLDPDELEALENQ